ncbi:hormonally up-regulated neu tumor-associated kinase homolog A [Acipenser ruthenus]|uniref:hormonally up-regulated neu tumor-associated kinase homolog A n=1 Tax=Acipenser ruthenus TaxID=7906 RepID=UPI00145BC1AE|nr:hormonally up-regulated neu tumor-associated kinase homolog A [Acipenser ruthenus]
MPAAIKTALEAIIADTGDLERIIPGWGRDNQVPACLSKVPQDVVKNFPHTKRVGNYLVGKMINKGSFAKVMEGLHISTGEKVAIKVIDKKKAKQDSYVLKNMKREPRIHQMIKHPNIVQLYETLETENSYYMVMELCLGGDLMDKICDRKKLEEREVRKYTRQIMSAVEHMHRHGIVHRDLKIENFLLDEYNNIKIVDFGLSNTLKPESLSLELLNTQCGSPAYAAPELLAHKKYGPKVDVWSIGVSMFAMLTGTLPFTVEPFNIKQLHQKMINGEISPIPSDISKGAVQFMLSFLEPDPAKRPHIKEAMEEKWLNNGYIKRPLNSVSYKNRLRPDELNSAVLNYMTENLDFSLSDIINTLINNRPSSIMAAYCLLVRKLIRHEKGLKTMKRDTVTEKNAKQTKPFRNPSHEAESKSSRKKTEMAAQENQKHSEKNVAIPSPAPALAEVITEEEIAITLENKESYFPEVSKFADRELVHLAPPKCSGKDVLDKPGEPVVDIQVKVEVNIDPMEASKSAKLPEQRTTAFENTPVEPIKYQENEQTSNPQTSSKDKGIPRLGLENKAHSTGPHQETRFKDILRVMDDKGLSPAWCCQEKEGRNFVAIDSPQLSPLLKLRQTALRDSISRKVTWVGTAKHSTDDSPPFLVNGSRPPFFPSSRQQALIVKSLRHSKEKTRAPVNNNIAKRNSIQIRHTHKGADLNLPVLSQPFQSKSNKKTELLRMDFG